MSPYMYHILSRTDQTKDRKVFSVLTTVETEYGEFMSAAMKLDVDEVRSSIQCSKIQADVPTKKGAVK